MLHAILNHTPLYVWAILVFLIVRGIAAVREREMPIGKLCIMPLAMTVLALQDIAVKFGVSSVTLGAWSVAALATVLLVRQRGGVRIAPGLVPGLVRVRGSMVPLAMMLAVFAVKYAVAVTLALAPALRHDTLAVAAVCTLFGVLNGVFLGRLAGDMRACRILRDQSGGHAVAA